MSFEIIFYLLLTGIISGLLAGFFGVGGGIIIVPALLSIYSLRNPSNTYTVHIAVATSLFTIIFTSASSAFKHYRIGNVELKAAIITGLAGSISVYIFSFLAISLSDYYIKIIFAVVLLIVSVKMFLSKVDVSNNSVNAEIKNSNNFLCVITGVVSGSVAAFTGLGGGIFITPLMKFLMKFPVKKAIGTSSAAIVLTAITGSVTYGLNFTEINLSGKYFFGLIDSYSALIIVITSVPFSLLGVKIHEKAASSLLNRLFAGFVLLIALKIVLL